jgi:hypothetical protein
MKRKGIVEIFLFNLFRLVYTLHVSLRSTLVRLLLNSNDIVKLYIVWQSGKLYPAKWKHFFRSFVRERKRWNNWGAIMTSWRVQVEVVWRQFHFEMKMKQLCTHNDWNIINSDDCRGGELKQKSKFLNSFTFLSILSNPAYLLKLVNGHNTQIFSMTLTTSVSKFCLWASMSSVLLMRSTQSDNRHENPLNLR